MTEKENKSFEDFLLDETFREYVTGSSSSSVEYWSDWISRHPEQAEEAAKAAGALRILMNTRKQKISADKYEAVEVLKSEIDKFEKSHNRRMISVSWLKIASAILLVTGLAWGWQYLSGNRQKKFLSEQFNEVIVPVGEKSQVVLSDGSHVWINSGSRFRYPVTFGKTSRDVTLEGEAYFDVTKNGRSAFTVNTHDARIVVLGTAFNVKSYPEDLKTQTTVVRGLVRVESLKKGIAPVLIHPNQMAEIKVPEAKKTSAPKMEVVDRVNTIVITSWKDQMLVFADETFEDLVVKMERWFNIKIVVADPLLKQQRYTGKFVHNENVYQVLEAIKLTTPIEYSIHGNEIIISSK